MKLLAKYRRERRWRRGRTRRNHCLSGDIATRSTVILSLLNLPGGDFDLDEEDGDKGELHNLLRERTLDGEDVITPNEMESVNPKTPPPSSSSPRYGKRSGIEVSDRSERAGTK